MYQIKLRRWPDGSWPNPETPSEPDNIKWENIGQNNIKQGFKRIFSWILAIIIIFFAFSGIIYFNQLSKFSKTSDFVNI